MMNELRTIAKNMNRARPDWDLAGCLTVLARLDLTHPGLDGATDPNRIRAAAERAAADPKARTPAALTFARYWDPPTAQRLIECHWCRSPHRPKPDRTRCAACRRPWRERTPE